MTSLTDKALIASCGRLDAPGRPMLYATTEKFLRVFGLRSLSELPETEIMVAPNDMPPMIPENADQVTIDSEVSETSKEE